jgi:hypothetical protein
MGSWFVATAIIAVVTASLTGSLDPPITSGRSSSRPAGGGVEVDEIDGVLAALASDRPVFHSEADFQHSLAWALQMREPGRRIRLEYRAPVDEVMHVDILVVEPAGRRIAIELKCWTRQLEVTTGDEAFVLRNQGAHDISRYDFVKDIARIERLISTDVADAGWVIAITNDAAYWNPATRRDTIDAAFRIGHGRVLQGELAWAAHAGAGTTRGRLLSHFLSGRYELVWKDYSEVAAGPSGILRYLAVPVTEASVRAEGYEAPPRPSPNW